MRWKYKENGLVCQLHTYHKMWRLVSITENGVCRASVLLRNRQDRSILEKAKNVMRPCAVKGIDY